MRLDGVGGDAEPGCDLLVAHTVRQQPQDLTFTTREQHVIDDVARDHPLARSFLHAQNDVCLRVRLDDSNVNDLELAAGPQRPLERVAYRTRPLPVWRRRVR